MLSTKNLISNDKICEFFCRITSTLFFCIFYIFSGYSEPHLHNLITNDRILRTLLSSDVNLLLVKIFLTLCAIAKGECPCLEPFPGTVSATLINNNCKGVNLFLKQSSEKETVEPS